MAGVMALAAVVALIGLEGGLQVETGAPESEGAAQLNRSRAVARDPSTEAADSSRAGHRPRTRLRSRVAEVLDERQVD